MDNVHTIDAIHDGCPLVGIADYHGRPHAYERQFDDDNDTWSDKYILKEVGADLLALALERQELFSKWRKAFDDGKVTIDTHPLLASDRPRYNELEDILANRIAGLPESARVIGRFSTVSLDQFVTTVQWAPLNL